MKSEPIHYSIVCRATKVSVCPFIITVESQVEIEIEACLDENVVGCNQNGYYVA